MYFTVHGPSCTVGYGLWGSRMSYDAPSLIKFIHVLFIFSILRQIHKLMNFKCHFPFHTQLFTIHNSQIFLLCTNSA